MSRELCIMACVFCRDKQFHRWVEENIALSLADGQIGEDSAKQYILGTCGIESRNQLDTNETAAQRFHEKIRVPFTTWRDAQQTAQEPLL